jgi:hypothetical protein
MEACGQLQASAVLAPEKELPISIEYEVGSVRRTERHYKQFLQ